MESAFFMQLNYTITKNATSRGLDKKHSKRFFKQKS